MAVEIVATESSGRYTYVILRDLASKHWGLARISGRREEVYPLEEDKRHHRFFLLPADQQRIGIDGLVVLERLARRVLR
jgi:hypothetical protein